MTEKHIELAANLLRARNACRSLYGDQWKEKQDQWRPIIQAVMKKHNCNEFDAILIMGKDLEGIGLMSVLGTVMEMQDDNE